MTGKDESPLPHSAILEIARSIARKMAREDHAKAREEGRHIVEPPPAPTSELDALIAGTNDGNRHGEIEAGPAVGNEIPKR